MSMPRYLRVSLMQALRLSVVTVCTLLYLGAAGAQEPAAKDKARGITTRLEGAIKEDFDGLMTKHRGIRVVAPYSRTLYFNDKGRERGISADFVRDFERWINQKYQK